MASARGVAKRLNT